MKAFDKPADLVPWDASNLERFHYSAETISMMSKAKTYRALPGSQTLFAVVMNDQRMLEAPGKDANPKTL